MYKYSTFQLVDDTYSITPTSLLEWFLIECHKTKTKVITVANHKRRGQYKTQSLQVTDAKCGKMRVNVLQLVLVLLLIE